MKLLQRLVRLFRRPPALCRNCINWQNRCLCDTRPRGGVCADLDRVLHGFDYNAHWRRVGRPAKEGTK
jgi:hypothetical protein